MARAPLHTLIIDNHDSFTFNLFQLLAEVNGAEPVVVRNDAVPWSTLAAEGFDNVVISPGPGRPDRPADFGICGEAILAAAVPVLGVCLGHQGIAAAYGGAVRRAPEPVHGRRSAIHHDGSPLFAGIPQGFAVVRYHSLIVDPALPPCLRASAWTDDGLIMALAHRTLPRWGVQFHPESICTEHGARLLGNFAALTRAALTRAALGERPRPRGLSTATPGGARVDASATAGNPEAARPDASEAPELPALELRTRAIPFPSRDVEHAFRALYGDAPDAFWLDSSRAEPGLARFSFIGAGDGPLAARLTHDGRAGETTIVAGGRSQATPGGVFAALERELGRRRRALAALPALPFDLDGGFVGYLGYELKAGLGGGDRHASELADAAFIFADRLIAFDHEEDVAHLVALCPGGGDDGGWIERSAGALAALPRSPAPPPSGAPLRLRLAQPRPAYIDAIDRCQGHIREGESYELCLTNQILCDPIADPLALYLALRRGNPAPYAAFLRLAGATVLSSSPERFLRIDRAGQVESRPIKGTRARGDTPERDEALRRDLATGEKDRSENLMIVDLLRNDLGRVCAIGSVHVPRLMEVETYESVHQLVSTVRGQLRPGVSAVECARVAFPGGSMTGAPKERTMRLLDALEVGPRGIYSGAIGYFALGGAADLNIVIRTLVTTASAASIGVGGAIVALSDPDEEFEETLIKARALIDALIVAARGEPDRALRERILGELRERGQSSRPGAAE